MRVLPFMALVLTAMLGACDDRARPYAVPGGNPELGRRLMLQYQCSACHAATGGAGPPLQAFGSRSYIAGRIPNLPDPLIAWLMDPPALKPGTLMPNMGISQAEARHMAAYLYTLE